MLIYILEVRGIELTVDSLPAYVLGWALNIAIGFQILLGALITSMAAVKEGVR